MTDSTQENAQLSQTSAPQTVKVWDPLVRIFHWTLVSTFFGAYIFDSPRNVHEILGWIAAGAIMFRIIWGLIGSKHARFSDFIPKPITFLRYIRDTFLGRERRHIGHNPAGGAMIVALIIMVGAIAVTGWMMGLDAYWGEDWVEELHVTVVNITLALVALHVGGVIWESLRHKENLVKSMFTGRKRM